MSRSLLRRISLAVALTVLGTGLPVHAQIDSEGKTPGGPRVFAESSSRQCAVPDFAPAEVQLIERDFESRFSRRGLSKYSTSAPAVITVNFHVIRGASGE